MKPLNSMAFFGPGKPGVCLAATLAARGLDVVGAGRDAEKARRINAGEP